MQAINNIQTFDSISSNDDISGYLKYIQTHIVENPWNATQVKCRTKIRTHLQKLVKYIQTYIVEKPTVVINKPITTCQGWKDSYINNRNTGVVYEKKTGEYILQNYPNINGLYNYSQKDNIGGTADLGILYTDGSLHKYSVTMWRGSLNKCLANFSGRKIYGLIKTSELEERNVASFKLALEYRKENMGKTPNKKWKRVRGPGSKHMCEYLARIASESWNKMSAIDKRRNLGLILDLDSKLNPNADGIIFWNNKKKCIEKIYKWELNINLDDYLETYSEGIYIYHGTPGNTIIKTQAKYNNSIIKGMSSKLDPKNWILKKSPSYLSSWNCAAPDLNKIFTMTELFL